MDFLKTLPTWVWIIPVVIILYFVAISIYLKKNKNRKENYLEKNPNAAQISPMMGIKGVKSMNVTIQKIDGKIHKEVFTTGLKAVYIVNPGTHILEVEASTTRPGVVHKSVTEVFGPVKIEVEVEPKKKYMVGFNTKEKEFTFTEEA